MCLSSQSVDAELRAMLQAHGSCVLVMCMLVVLQESSRLESNAEQLLRRIHTCKAVL